MNVTKMLTVQTLKVHIIVHVKLVSKEMEKAVQVRIVCLY